MTLFQITNAPLHIIPIAVLICLIVWGWTLGKLTRGLRLFLTGIVLLSFVVMTLFIILSAFTDSPEGSSLWNWSLEVVTGWSLIMIPFILIANVGERFRQRSKAKKEIL